MEELLSAKLKKLEEQRRIADELTIMLTKEGGLCETSDRLCKNLVAAVAVAKRPGFFEYYEPPDAVREILETGRCGSLVRRMRRLQKDIDRLDADLRDLQDRQKQAEAIVRPNIASLDQWFASFGRPKDDPTPGLVTTFQKDTKIYGKTSRHKAFKTHNVVMKRGRL
mmetsp:Transcript_9798/g.31900  ORF Transcript_9798/g.31900 Transcript_9798/m.31900 type:complete len:167 (+) Transcript_9798:74-574(+)